MRSTRGTARLVVGSTAARAHLPWWREPKDLDVFSDAPEPGAEAFWDDAFEPWLRGVDRPATLDELVTIKVSHSYWELRNGSWRKHIEDARLLMEAGARVDDDLHALLYGAWERLHGVKKLDLDQEAADFFSDAVRRRYDHDSLHRSVAYEPGKPMYERVLKPGSEVATDMAAVRAMSHEDQIRLYREEVYATALERLIIPNDYLYSPTAAYAWALRRTITSLTKGWSARFLVENYGELKKPDMNYVEHHRANAHYLEEL